jgi:hypothetical protein
MEMNVEELKDWKDGARRQLDRGIERFREKKERLQDYSRWMMEATDELIAENERLSYELQKVQAEVEWARQQWLRSYLKTSKRKTLAKREAAKMVITELFANAKVELPDDIVDMLDHLDDEQIEPKVVNVAGCYNEIHDNGRVTV